MLKRIKGKINATVNTTTKRGAIKPKLGRGTGGFITTSLKMKVEKDKNKSNG